MSDEKDGWAEWSKHVLIELERLNNKIDSLNNKISNVETIKGDVRELKEWKSKVEEHQSPTQLEKHLEEHDALKTFKTQAMMIFVVVQAIMGIIVFWKDIFN
jgi:hypothetical protein